MATLEPMAVHATGKVRNPRTTLEEQVLLAMSWAGYRVTSQGAPWNYLATRPSDGARIVIKSVKRNAVVNRDALASQVPEAAAEGWVVYGYPRRESLVEHGLKLRLLDLRQLDFQMGYEGEQVPPSGPTAIASKIGVNRASILANARALQMIIDERLALLNAELPNSPEVTSQRDDLKAQFEGLRDRVGQLEDAVKKFTVAKPTTAGPVAKHSSALRKFLDDWLKRSGPAILDQAAVSAVALLMATALCLALEVTPDTAALVSSGLALSGGKGKKIAKKAARLIQNI